MEMIRDARMKAARKDPIVNAYVSGLEAEVASLRAALLTDKKIDQPQPKQAPELALTSGDVDAEPQPEKASADSESADPSDDKGSKPKGKKS